MNIEELTIKQTREIARIFSAEATSQNNSHPLLGRKVIAVLPHGFVHFGTLCYEGSSYVLKNASNIRYWQKRGGGLPELARSGLLPADRIDDIGDVYFDAALFFYPCGDWS